MAHMYILRCNDGSFYVGSTVDLERRLGQHNEGEGAAYTRKRRPVALAYAEEFSRVDDAYFREKQVQGWSRAKRLALIEGRLADLPALARSKAVRDRAAPGGVSTGSTSGAGGSTSGAGGSTGGGATARPTTS